ncbi:MAG: ABC transporter substrate-binding protein [Minwuia sp.]|uniref:ABC transporter substrate-binding protein n=1 Tax=Minwuia sp. TaxID=2493630 RepID=UPI003A8891B6
MIRSFKFRLPILALAAALTLASVPASAAGEREAIERLNSVLVETMKGGEAKGFDWRYEQLDAPLSSLFDFRTMTQVGLQRYWSDLAEAERTAITEAFERMSIATFAGRFDAYNGERFEVEGEQPGPRGLVLVPSVIHRAGKDSVKLTYVMRNTDKGPVVIDILAQGKFSELARQRAEMSSVYSREGAEGLIASLNAKSAELAAR